MVDMDIIAEKLEQLHALEEKQYLARFHQQVQKAREMARDDWHIKKIIINNWDLVLLHDSKFARLPSNFMMHWIGPYIIRDILDGAAI